MATEAYLIQISGYVEASPLTISLPADRLFI